MLLFFFIWTIYHFAIDPMGEMQAPNTSSLDFVTLVHDFVSQFEPLFQISEWSSRIGSQRAYVDVQRIDWDEQHEHFIVDYDLECIIYRRDPPPTMDAKDQGSHLSPLINIWDIKDYLKIIPMIFPNEI
jgi:hypothetical protein